MSLIWKPLRKTKTIIQDSLDRKKAFKVFRQSSSGYISKNDVRKFIIKKFNSKCNICSSSENLEIDHIDSVYSCFNRELYNYCNSIQNLQLLCKKCNTSKRP